MSGEPIRERPNGASMCQYVIVCAEQERPRDFCIDGMKMRKDAILASHVMRGLDLRADGRTA